MQIGRAARRALHELDMSTIDLRAAEKRRELGDEQLEKQTGKVRSGLLGIEAVG